MTFLGERRTLCLDQLPLSVDMEGFNISTQKLIFYSDLFNSVGLSFHHKCLSSDGIGNGAMLT